MAFLCTLSKLAHWLYGVAYAALRIYAHVSRFYTESRFRCCCCVEGSSRPALGTHRTSPTPPPTDRVGWRVFHRFITCILRSFVCRFRGGTLCVLFPVGREGVLYLLVGSQFRVKPRH